MFGCCKMVWDHRWPLRPVKKLKPPLSSRGYELRPKVIYNVFAYCSRMVKFQHFCIEEWFLFLKIPCRKYTILSMCGGGHWAVLLTWGFPNLNVWLRNNISQENIEKSNRPVKCSFSTLTFLGTQSHTDFSAALRGSRFGRFPLLDDALTALCVWAWNLKTILVIEEFVRKPTKNWHLFLSPSAWFQQEDVVPRLL